jgi:hypothetical protein
MCYRSLRSAQGMNYAMLQGRYEDAFESVLKAPFDLGSVLESS